MLIKKLGYKKAPTLNKFVEDGHDIDLIREYEEFLRGVPKRKDFINFDNDGYALNDNKPLFKGWHVCKETSIENMQVAKIGENRIYFNSKEGVIISSLTHMTDNLTYNDLFIFFEGKLKLR